MKKAFQFIGIMFAVLFAIIVIALIVDISNDDEKAKDEPKKTEQQPEKKEETAPIDWKAEITKIAQSKGTPTEKYDQIRPLVKKYKTNDEEIDQFFGEIKQSFLDKSYLSDITNDEFMLTNIFKSDLIEQNLSEGDPRKDFAYDFYQNSKYTYRGADAVDSEAVKSNEEQMNKALSEIK